MPDWTPLLRSRLERLRVSPSREREIVEELSQHLDERYRELLAEGRSEVEARRLAIEELEGPDALTASLKALRQANAPPPLPPPGTPRRALLADVWSDLRYAARVLRRAPGFTAAAVLTLALGIGANSAMFALVDATLLRPLPFPQPDRLVKMWEQSAASPRGGVSPLNLADWNTRNQSFQVIGGYVPNVGGMVMSGADGTAETVPRQWVTAGVFDALGITPVAGRTFIPSDDTQQLNVVVLGEAFWRSRFNADPAIIGKDLRLDGEPFTVVGVVPKEAEVLGRSSMWAARSIAGPGIPPRARGARIFQTIGRLKPGVSPEAARGDMAAVAEGLAREHPQFNAGRGVATERLDTALIGSELRRSAVLFLGVVGFVLLICCGNVANLLLTRATVRRRELAIRAALGADRARVIRQLLTESLLLAAVGGALGMAAGAGILAAAPALLPADLMPSGVTLTFDARVAMFCAAAALLVGCLFGIAPAWQATTMSSAQTVMAEGRTTTGRGGRLRSILVVAEVATAVVLLFGAGLLLRTLLELNRVDRGYRAESVLTMIVDPLGSEYPTTDSLLQFYETVRQEVSAAPGVRSAAWATTLPMGPSYAGTSAFEVVGEPRDEGAPPIADLQIVSPGYFATIDLPIVAGRPFGDRDVGDSPQVCIVNEAFVRRHFQGRSPIGARVALRPPENPQAEPEVREIVGVARQVKSSPDEAVDLLQVYTPLAQNPIGDIYLLVTPIEGRAEALTSTVRAAIGRIDRKQLVSVRDIMTLEGVTQEATARYRFRALMVGGFAGLALLLAMTGLFGTLAYTVQQRVREFGVRRALGATGGDVLTLVASSALRIIGIGAGVGLVLAALTSGLLSTMLYGVRPLDPLTIAGVLALLVITAAASIAAPAWRAARVDPVVALRTE
jgi:putative ABC transport system permease protein